MQVKRQAEDKKEKSANLIVEEIIQDLREEGDHQLPKIMNEARCLNRHWASFRPAELSTLQFELDLQGCDVPPNFMKADIVSSESRHIVFATSEQLRLLADARAWYVDVIFKVARQPFYQLLSIHAFLHSDDCVKQVSLAFALMSRRRAEDYNAVFNAIKRALPSLPDLDTIVCDFEAAVWQSIRSAFPGIHIHGCSFHWSQLVYRQAGNLGLHTAYRQKGPIFKFIKHLLALHYLP